MNLTRDFETHSTPTPPPLPSLHFQASGLNSQAANSLAKVDENELDVAVKRLLMLDADFGRIFHFSNTYLTPQLQVGPKCGLVALSIATSGRKDFVPVDDIFQRATSLGLTKQGEMFSADSLALLAEKCCGFRTRIIKGGLSSHVHCIIKSLLRECLLLIPYDADCNHSPCCKKGFNAHWALITGFLIVERNAETNAPQDHDVIVLNSLECSGLCGCSDGISDTDFPLIISAREGKIVIGKGPPKDTRDKLKEGKIYLVGMQGKSRHVGLWLFDDVAKSNDNLIFFSTNRDSDSYVLPKGGVEEGLKGKATILDGS